MEYQQNIDQHASKRIDELQRRTGRGVNNDNNSNQ